MTEIVKDWLWRQVWRNVPLAERFSHVCDGYDVDELDPEAIFNYQVENPPFTVYHFIAHMVIMRNTLPLERYRRHRHWVFIEQRRHVPSFKELLVLLVCGLF